MENEPKPEKLNNSQEESLSDKIARLRLEVIAVKGRFFMMSEEFLNFVNNLKKKYPNFEKWRAYHVLVASDMFGDEAGVIEEDFPGEDSVVGFLNSFLNKQ